MSKSSRYMWQKRWTLDRQAGTATHQCGLLVNMGGAPPRPVNDRQVLQVLAQDHGAQVAPEMIRRMIREAAALWAVENPRDARL